MVVRLKQKILDKLNTLNVSGIFLGLIPVAFRQSLWMKKGKKSLKNGEKCHFFTYQTSQVLEFLTFKI